MTVVVVSDGLEVSSIERMLYHALSGPSLCLADHVPRPSAEIPAEGAALYLIGKGVSGSRSRNPNLGITWGAAQASNCDLLL